MTNKERAPITWTDFSALRWGGVDKPNSRMGKLKLHEFAKKNDLNCLDVITKFDSASAISLSTIPSEFFVLKAEGLWSGKGIYVLHKIVGTDLFYDVKNDKAWTEGALKEAAAQLEFEKGKKLPFFVEKKAVDEDQSKHIPLDYKLFTFYGSVKFILQVDRNYATPKICFFDGEFNPIVDSRVQPAMQYKQAEAIHRVPRCSQQMIALAQNVTKKLCAPFISVDCYATSEGAVLGELTHTPGGPWFQSMYSFSDEFDLELGQAWHEASHALGIRIPMLSVPYTVKLKDKLYRTIY